MIEYSGESESSSKFNEIVRAKIDTLLSAFNELGWSNQKEMSKDEMFFFLNNFLSNNKEFDKTLSEKLFNILNVDNTNKILVEEFIKGYLQFENDLQKQQQEFINKLQSEQINFNNFDEQCRLYRNEKLSSEGFSDNAKISIEITNLEIKRHLENVNKIIIELIYNNQNEECQLDFNKTFLEVNKIFEFKPISKRDEFDFMIKAVNNNNEIFEIGQRSFPLNEITTQDECIVQIAVSETNNKDIVSAIINSKILLYFSNFRYYDEKRKKSEQKITKLEDAINKLNKYLKQLNEIYNRSNKKQVSNMDIPWNNEIIKPKTENSKSDYIEIDNINYNNSSNIKNQKADYYNNKTLESNIENIGNMNYIKGLNIIKLLGVVILICALIGGIWRTDFHNQLGGLLIYLVCVITQKNSEEKNSLNFKCLLIFIPLLILYDFIWIIINFGRTNIDKYTGGNENFIVKFSILMCFINIVAKGVISIYLFKVYKFFKSSDSLAINY